MQTIIRVFLHVRGARFRGHRTTGEGTPGSIGQCDARARGALPSDPDERRVFLSNVQGESVCSAASVVNRGDDASQ